MTLFGTGFDMSLAEQHKIVDEWAAKRKKRVGIVRIPQLGEYPPNLDIFYGSMMNEYVTTDLIRHYADATGDRNPLWRSEEYARGTRWGGIIAPPTFTDSILQPYPQSMEPEWFLKFGSISQAPFGSKRQLFKPIRPGDKMKDVDRILSFEEIESKKPAPCREFIEIHQRTLSNQRDEVVAVIDIYFDIFLNAHVDPEHPAFGIRKKHKFTDEERDAITRGYDEEKIRGADTLFWEDVKVGDELDPLIVGPLTVWDNAAWMTAIAGHAVAFDVEWERIKRFFEWHWLDPEVNAWTCAGICHFVDEKGHASDGTGGPAIGFASQLEGLMGRMICRWMGDDGFLKLLDTRVPCYPILGEAFHCTGKVTKKSTKGNEHLVDLEVRCENQDGLLLVTGDATVELLTRTEMKVQ